MLIDLEFSMLNTVDSKLFTGEAVQMYQHVLMTPLVIGQFHNLVKDTVGAAVCVDNGTPFVSHMVRLFQVVAMYQAKFDGPITVVTSDCGTSSPPLPSDDPNGTQRPQAVQSPCG